MTREQLAGLPIGVAGERILRMLGIVVSLTAMTLGLVWPVASTIAPKGQLASWELLFPDEFDGTSLDGNKWVTCYWWGRGGCTNLGNHELQWYQSGNVAVAGGQLHLRAKREEVRGQDDTRCAYTSGLISTGRDVEDTARAPKFDFRYGYAEMRARLPAGRGLFPAFWMLPSSHSSKPEIDIMEVLGHEPNVLYSYFHYRDALGTVYKPRGVVETSDLSAGWDVFGVDWQPDRIVWYLDGVERWRYQDADHIPNETMYILVNLAVGGTWPGPPDSLTRWPADMLVDYVRVWKRIDR
jgi:beta-glucanase (GH16 family)